MSVFKSLSAAAAVLLLFSFGSVSAGDLHADVFGNVYDGDDPFEIGEVESVGSGPLHSDVFGNVYAGDSPFPVGQIDPKGGEGALHRDVFGNVRVGDSPFEVDISPILRDD